MNMPLLNQSFCIPLQGDGGFPYFSRRWVEGVPSLTGQITERCYLIFTIHGAHYMDEDHFIPGVPDARPFAIFLDGGDDGNLMLRFETYTQLENLIWLLKTNPDGICIAFYFS